MADTPEWPAVGDDVWAYVEDDDDGGMWEVLPVRVKSEEGAVSCVLNGRLREFALDKLAKHYPSHDTNYDDISLMDYLHEAPLLALLRRRFEADTIYTFSSNMVISVNPFKPIEGLYDNLSAPTGLSSAPPVPHVFTVAARSYRDMLQLSRAQSVLMSGESGAGKTEASKRVIQYLVLSEEVQMHSREGLGGMGVDHARRLEDGVIKSVPLLEAFGNAQTINNVNSSRFGKYLKLRYSPTGAVLGASTTTFLLEKSRIVQHSEGERTFHIMYRLVDGATPEEREVLKLDADPDVYHYLNQGEVGTVDDEAGGLDAIREQLASIGIDAGEQATLFQAVAAVVHLGNVAFEGVDGHSTPALGDPVLNGEAAIAKDDSAQKSLAAVASLLGLNAAMLEMTLTQRTMSAGRRKSVSSIPLTVQQAMDSRNGLAKALYERLFWWLVRRINTATNAGDEDAAPAAGSGETKEGEETEEELAAKAKGYIGILDIFGFEKLQENGFEQLCINFANETLQQVFIQAVFVAEAKEYERQGLSGWQTVPFKDNQDVIDLISRPRTGVFALLDQQALLGERGSDGAFVASIKKQHLGSDEAFKDEAPPLPETFVIAHYASDVTYVSTRFVARNNDALHHDLAQLPPTSTSPFITNLFSLYPCAEALPSGSKAAAGTVTRGGQHRMSSLVTVSQRFTEQLSKLVKELTRTMPQFVRCVKPNDSQEADEFDDAKVLHQLNYMGVLETVKAALDTVAKDGDCRTMIAAMLEATLGPQGDGGWAVGKDMVFLRNGVLEQLAAANLRRLNDAVLRIQARAKGVVARLRFEESKRQALRLKCIIRMLMAVKRRRRLKEARAATAIRARFLAHRQLRAYGAARKDVIKAQAFTRGALQRRREQRVRDHDRHLAATSIQAAARCRAAHQAYLKARRAAVRIEAVARGVPMKRRYGRYIGAVIKLQACFRRLRLHRRHKHVVDARRKWRTVLRPSEAVVLQSLVRKRREKGGLFKQDRRRQLILTTHNRILYLDPAASPVDVKGVIPFDENLAVTQLGPHDFDIQHTEVGDDGAAKKRVMHLTDLMGDSARWARAIESASKKAMSVADLYNNELPPSFEIQGMLFKKNKTSKGWNQRFFVLQAGELVYFAKPSDDKGRGKYIIEATTRIVDCDLRPFAWGLITPGERERGPIVAASSAREMDAWKSSFMQVVSEKRRLASSRRSVPSLPSAGAGSSAPVAATPPAPPS